MSLQRGLGVDEDLEWLVAHEIGYNQVLLEIFKCAWLIFCVGYQSGVRLTDWQQGLTG